MILWLRDRNLNLRFKLNLTKIELVNIDTEKETDEIIYTCTGSDGVTELIYSECRYFADNKLFSDFYKIAGNTRTKLNNVDINVIYDTKSLGVL